MNNDREYGTRIDADEISSVLEPTRILRLALEVLWGSVPADMETDAIQKALNEIHEGICARELKGLLASGINRQYTIIRPFDMMKLPDSESMRRIAGAIQVLDDHGLIAGPGSV